MIINKIKEIVQSYAISMNPSGEQKELAEKRLAKCMGCEMWTTNAAGMQICRKCGCLTKVKVFTPRGQEACPLGKWTV